MEPILEFNYKFEGDEEEHIINIQTKSDLLIISIELESKGLYWYKELDSKTLSDVHHKWVVINPSKSLLICLFKLYLKKMNHYPLIFIH